MTDRDHFAAAALTGLLAQGDDGSFSEESYVRAAYRWADAMLLERGNQPEPPDSSPVTEPMPKEKRAEVSDGSEPVAWAVAFDSSGEIDCEFIYPDEASAGDLALDSNGSVVPLYRQPQPTLTNAEREAVEVAVRLCHPFQAAATLRGLLERLK